VNDPFPLPNVLKKLLDHGFIVITRNPDAPPESRIEAWAYQGPLDFSTASPLRFGLGRNPGQAIAALVEHLSPPSSVA
jgi:hypothetical protein